MYINDPLLQSTNNVNPYFNNYIGQVLLEDAHLWDEVKYKFITIAAVINNEDFWLSSDSH